MAKLLISDEGNCAFIALRNLSMLKISKLTKAHLKIQLTLVALVAFLIYLDMHFNNYYAYNSVIAVINEMEMNAP